MAGFTVRVQLTNIKAGESDLYEELHEQMALKGFATTITCDDDETYELPNAEYSYSGNLKRSDVLKRAKEATSLVTDGTGMSYMILVTESKGRTWSGLKKVKSKAQKIINKFNELSN